MTRAGWLVVAIGVSLGLGACHDPWSTGPYGIRGRLLDSTGQPIALKRVASEEHGVMSEDDGRFVVRWKDPAAFVDIRDGGITFRRKWLPGTDTGEVEVRLPTGEAGTVTCRSDVECVAEVEWDLGGGLSGRMDIDCGGKTAPIRVGSLPPGLPTTVTCPSLLGDRPMRATRVGHDLQLEGEPLALPITIDGASRDADCTVKIIDGKMERVQGIWGLQPDKETWAWAVCNGRPGAPTAVSPRTRGLRDDDARVSLPWSDVGPSFTLAEPVPEPRRLTLSRRASDTDTGWTMHMEPGADGKTYLLPALPRGQYLLGLGSAALFAATNPPEPEVPGLVYLAKDGEVWGEDGGMVGALSLEEDLASGVIEVEIQGLGATPE